MTSAKDRVQQKSNGPSPEEFQKWLDECDAEEVAKRAEEVDDNAKWRAERDAKRTEEADLEANLEAQAERYRQYVARMESYDPTAIPDDFDDSGAIDGYDETDAIADFGHLTPGSVARNAPIHLDDLPLDSNTFVVFARVSKADQKKTGNLEDQFAEARDIVAKRGGVVVGTFGSACRANSAENRRNIADAIKLCRELGADLLTESICKLRRAVDYLPTDQKHQASRSELESVLAITQGVQIVTLAPPGCTSGGERSFQTKRGLNQKAKKKLANKLSRKKRKAERLPGVLLLHSEGISNRAIGRLLDLRESTVRLWLKSPTSGCAVLCRDDDGWTY